MQVRAIIFDKTGTLTNGKPEVSRVILYNAQATCPTKLFLSIVGLAENNSEHPLGQAVSAYVKKVSLITTVRVHVTTVTGYINCVCVC